MTKNAGVKDIPTVYDRVFKPAADCILYHYCSSTTFLSIVTNGTVRFSDANMMNDSAEGRYGYALFEQAANDLLAMVGQKPILEGLSEDFFAKVDNYLSPSQFVTHPVISCFSKQPDSLSQWRAYGQDGSGWAIGFGGDALTAMPVMLLEVLYDRDKQLEEVRNFLAAMYAIWRSKGGDFNDAVGNEAALLSSLLLAYKHPSFSEEQEVRALHELRVDLKPDGWSLIDEGGTASGKPVPGRPICYRAVDSSIVAYIDLPLEYVEGSSIRELWFGPRNKNGPGNAIYPLTQHGHLNVALHWSGSSYRG